MLYRRDERGCGEQLYILDLALRIEAILMTTCRNAELMLLFGLKRECK